MKKLSLIGIILFVAIIYLPGDFYFKDSDHELEVIRIRGKKPGPTMLIFGGIHGDEPGGYFSSEIMAEIQLENGTLILVPRVNFPGIMTNRRELYGDMNRKFLDKEYPEDPDFEVIKILKGLMSEADVFINQHDASGFHRKRYISKTYNPFRYGQSLIVDTGKFYSEKLKKEIDLEAIGNRIINRVNDQIKNEKFHFCFWNHNSILPNTKFQDMQSSATYYALTHYSIPGFGLETSKDLPSLNHKIKHQTLVIQEILREFGFEFTLPSVEYSIPRLHWVEFLKNGQDIIRVNDNTNVRLNSGDKIKVTRIHANYSSGLSANILKWGSLNDLNREFLFQQPCRITIKKNHFSIGRIKLKYFLPQSIRHIHLENNGVKISIPNWGKITLNKDQGLKILGASPGSKRMRFDLRGFSLVSGKKDDSNVTIYPEDLIAKYSFNGEGKIYFVRIYLGKNLSGGFQVELF